ncbi:MAG: hypothetical protein KDA58_13830, partial [Planctomycetaceae bacterium]|nr:hypothetical protein [Planctomycetaceae bacterium]
MSIRGRLWGAVLPMLLLVSGVLADDVAPTANPETPAPVVAGEGAREREGASESEAASADEPAPVTEEQWRSGLERRGYVVEQDTAESDDTAKWVPVDPSFLLGATAADQLALLTDRSFATLESATYTATFSGDDLRAGEFTGRVTKVGNQVAILDWTDVNLAVQRLQQQRLVERSVANSPVVEEVVNDLSAPVPARWGTAPDGRSLVLISAPETVLTGRWSARGLVSEFVQPGGANSVSEKTIVAATTFDLVLPAALHTQLRLRLPAGKQLVASAGLLSEPQPMAEGWHEWTLDLGRRRQVRLTVENIAPLPPSPLLLGKVENAYFARSTGLTVQADVGLEVFGASAASLKIEFPNALEIQGAAINSVPVPLQINPERPGEAVILCGDLPVGQFSLLRVTASQSPRWGTMRALPRVSFPDIRVTQERTTLFVESPLAVRAVSTDRLLQTGLGRDMQGELWTFQGLERNPKFQVEIGERRAEVDASTAAVVVWTADLAFAVCDLDLQTTSGTAYAASFRVPDGWDVLDTLGRDAASQLVTWIVESQGGSDQVRI